MDSKIPTPVQHILNDYIALFNERIPNTLEGLYLHGSIALNAYSNGISDIDFISVLNRHLTEKEVSILTDVHVEMNKKFINTGMDGCYLLWEDIGKKQKETKNYIFVNEGKLGRGNHFINPVTWWIMRDKGIRIMGPDITSFHFDVDESELANYVLNNMNYYWLNRMNKIAKDKRSVFLLPNKLVDQEVEWSITGMLRQFYTLREHEIISKAEACKYAIIHLPVRWHNIINEALSIREGLNIRYYDSKTERIDDLVQCMNYILDYCNNVEIK